MARAAGLAAGWLMSSERAGPPSGRQEVHLIMIFTCWFKLVMFRGH